MEAFAYYLLKSSGILLLFYACYSLFLRKETLFRSNRWFLITGLLGAVLLPLVYFTKRIYLDFSSVGENSEKVQELSLYLNEPSTQWSFILVGIYVLGVIFSIYKLVFQIKAVYRFIGPGGHKRKNDLIYIESAKNIQPFSFFKYIIYNPKNHNTKELNLILGHEKVHAQQWHSIDILIMEVILVLQWFNPIAWLYKKAIKQNLEFLADTQNEVLVTDKKEYQYLLLRQAVGKQHLSIVNPFFNSLIKKRIVMINQIPSQKIKAIKTLLIVPLLALFLFSFNVRREYHYSNEATEASIELTIHKNTTDEELENIKKDLKKDDIDFSYTVVHNAKQEIISISLQIVGKSKNGSTFNSAYNSSDEDDVISPIVVLIDPEHNLVSIGSKGAYKKNNVHIDSDHNQVWISSGDEKHKKIRIEKKNGKKVVIVNGEEMSEEELEDMDIHMAESSNVFIHTDNDDEHDVHVTSGSGNGFFFIDTDGDMEPVYIIDGKESTKEEMKKLDPSEIESIDVSKGKSAKEKFGKKGKNGVVEVKTKKN